MQVGTDRIRGIVQSLRLFSHLDEAGIKAVDIHAGIDSALMILQNRLNSRGEYPSIQVIQNYADLPFVECYAGQLNQVFMNILVNAIDALEERDAKCSLAECQQQPSMISIQTEVTANDWISIQFKDNGIGIPEDIQTKIFDPFFTTKAVGKGTGMGMSISHQIITEKHGGRISFSSSPNQGTEFVIQIPVKQSETGASESS